MVYVVFPFTNETDFKQGGSILPKRILGSVIYEEVKMRGKVKFFHRKKGYGFVAGENGKDAFVHYSNINMEGSRFLETGNIVEYDEAPDDKGQKAVNLKLVD